MENTKSKKGANLVWNTFRSLKLTLTVLIILAITSIAGTVIPQGEGAIDFAKKLSPLMARIFNSLQLFDMYHSLWFRLIIGVLSLNLIICSIDRFPGTLRLFRSRINPDRSKPFENIASERVFFSKNEFNHAADIVRKILENRYKNITQKETAKGYHFYGEKGKYSLFGVYFVHLSVLIIIIGAIIGSLFGFEAFVNIPEGKTVGSVILKKSRHKINLGFKVQCNKFSVDFYDNGTPKEYRSDLSFIIKGKEEKTGGLLVNHPLTFKGITFYQSSYGTIPGNTARLRIMEQGGKPGNYNISIEKKKPLSLPGNDGEFQITNIREDFMRMGPAVNILIKSPKGEHVHFWIFQNQGMIKKRFPEIFDKFPKLNPAAYKPYTFFLDSIESSYYTGLQVNKDPGVPLVWLGFFMMIIGFFITFFISHQRLWVRVFKNNEGAWISIAGKANKNPVGMERELDQLKNKLYNKLMVS